MLRLTTLGALDVRDGRGRPLRELLAQPKRVALLVYLAVEGARGPVSRDALLALFWPESDDTRARNALSQSLHHIRQALGADAIQSHGSTSLSIDRGLLWCDASAFADAVDNGEGELALDLYRGEFCPTLFVSGAAGAEEWLDSQRRRFRGQVLAAAQAQAQRLLDRGDPDAAARTARRALALGPDDEAIVRSLLGVMDRAGETTGALMAYQEYEKRLAQSIGAEPEPKTRQLIAAIRRRREPDIPPEPAAPAGSPAPGASSPAPTPPSRRRGLALALAALVTVAVVGGLAAWRFSRPPLAAGRRTIAVFPFAVRGPNLDYLREGMTDLLSAKLEGLGDLHAVDPRSVIAASPSPPERAAASAITQRLGGTRYVTGDVVEIAGRLQVTASLYEVGEGPPLATATVSGDTTHLFELVDDLSGRMLAGLMQGRDSTLTRLASLTTTSLPALKAFLVGEQAMRAGRDGAAATAFQEAVALDSTFALAEYRLALSSTWVLVSANANTEQITRMAELAERHARRLTPLVRDLLAGYHLYKDFHPDEAAAIYRRITRSHPDNVEAWFMLGETHFHYNPWAGRSPEESRAEFERVLSLDPSNTHAILHLARLAARDGDTPRLDSLVRVYLSRYSDAERTLEIRALAAAVHDDSAGSAAVARDGSGRDAVVEFSALQAMVDYAQNLEAGRRLVPMFMRAADNRTITDASMRLVSILPLTEGRWGSSAAAQLLGSGLDRQFLRESQALLAATPAMGIPRARLLVLRDSIERHSPYPMLGLAGIVVDSASSPEYHAWLVGLLSARLGDTLGTRTALEQLERAPAGPRAETARNLVLSIRAGIAYASGRQAEGIDALRDFPFEVSARRGSNSWGNYERFMMAELLAGTGQDSAALRWYESFPAGYDVPWIPLAHLRAGLVCEKLGNRERAHFHYTRASAIWRNADPEIQPLLRQARDGLARVSRSG